MSTFHLVASSLANFNDTISTIYDSTLHLHQLFSSKQEQTFVMGSQLTLWGFHGEHQVNTEKLHQRVRVTVWGVCSIFAFIIKCMVIRCIFPCSFGNKCMHLLTVYMVDTSIQGLIYLGHSFNCF